MYTEKTNPVLIPSSSDDYRIFVPKRPGYILYITQGHWDKTKNRTIDKRTTIGKTIPDKPGYMYPSKQYFSLFTTDTDHFSNQVSSQILFGPFAVLNWCMEKTGCLNVLQDVFPGQWKEIRALAIYAIMTHHLVGQTFKYWFFHTYCGLEKSLSSSRISRLFDELSEVNGGYERFLEMFHKKYAEVFPVENSRVIGLDSTNQNTSSSNLSHTAHGHAKKKTSLPIINTAMFVDENTGIPIYYEHFLGSILDKSQTPFTMQRAADLGFQKLFVMMDRGYFDKKTAAAMEEQENEFGVMVPDNSVIVDELIEQYASQIINQNKYWIEEEQIYGIHISDYQVKSMEGTFDVYLYYDDARAAQERKSIHSKMDALKSKIESRKRYSDKLAAQFSKWFIVTKEEKDPKTGRNFSVKAKNEVVQAELEHAGLFVIVSNGGLEADEMIIIARYRSRNEKAFEWLKTDIGMDSLYTPRNISYEAEMFISFIAMIIEGTYRYYMRGYFKKFSGKTMPTTLGELSEYEIRYSKEKGWQPVEAVSSRQKEIMESLGLESDWLPKQVAKISTD